MSGCHSKLGGTADTYSSLSCLWQGFFIAFKEPRPKVAGEFKDTLSNKTLKDIYEESKLEVQNETTEGTEAFSVALATQMAINLLESYEKWLKEERAKEEN